MMPKYLKRRFEKATIIIKEEHKSWVETEIKYMNDYNFQETGARYDSRIGQGYRMFKEDNKFFIAIHPTYYIVEVN